MSDEEFDSEKSSLVTKLLKKKKRLFNLSMQFWGEITNQEFWWFRNEAYAECVKKLSKAETIEFFKVRANAGETY